MNILKRFKFPNKFSYVGSMDYCHLDSNSDTYSFASRIIDLSSGNGEVVEEVVSDYWDKFLKMHFIKMPQGLNHDFVFNPAKNYREVELRRFSKNEGYLHLGYGSNKKRRQSWKNKAELLRDGNGGYMAVLVDVNYIHLFWLPADVILKSPHKASKINKSQIKKLFDVDVDSYIVKDNKFSLDHFKKIKCRK